MSPTTLNNAFSGGAGTDTVTYAASTNALTVDLSAGTVTGTGVGTDTLTAIEIIRTGSGTDVFSAGAGGLGGVTTLDGGAGNDTLTTSAATLDLTGKTLTSIEQITTTNATGTAFTTGSIATRAADPWGGEQGQRHPDRRRLQRGAAHAAVRAGCRNHHRHLRHLHGEPLRPRPSPTPAPRSRTAVP